MKPDQPDNNPKRRTYSVPEAAAVSGLGVMAIYRGVRAGKIPHLPTGTRVIRIPIHAFHEWIDTAGGQIEGGQHVSR